ncbi:RsmB/NOP family class I SAM-dependent RNA methyltransferase [Olivibacter sp. SDN3]|uniref:RsmB/NOP family class I SAM-dependent RNA methyltransferase n=1 Tax=Olivibacter sp. SDN3 TaxID=2764720 RepID=UPI001650EF18|nr:RsmB/NOP family class I SAM-dependent RNA methyltransferase [Olivibacter sp. SDN3]QNL52150.1 RsmB/NOP family class I SAM-dependent RNA methyltransferase [Olivibacter sp. SDN3]
MNPKRIQQQLRTFQRMLDAYDGKQPLARFLTLFFKENKQMGANDRRTISHWAYSYYRLGNALYDSLRIERLMVAVYLCNNGSDVVAYLDPTLYQTIQYSFDKKIALLRDKYKFNEEDIYPLLSECSVTIDRSEFLKSLFRQPDLFIRIHRKERDTVSAVLDRNQITYHEVDSYCLALPNGTRLDKISDLFGKYQIQDLSSQRTAVYFNAKYGEKWWDACAASGGKSLLLLDTCPTIELLVSDVRPSILRNLDERFEQANIRQYRRKIVDLTKGTANILGNEMFDGIILDAPCSGSGTWGRTPEMMKHFEMTRLEYFVSLQRSIILNVIRHLKLNAPLIYITCSVYRRENEDQVAFLEQQGLQLEQMEVLKGYENRADTMFVARLIKNK